ncbi:MAG: DUF4249 family protein [Chitinophagales bacterium]
MKRNVALYLLAGVGMMGISSCTTDITLDIPEPELKMVVEGSIEQGLPPIISLTSTVPFYGEVNFNALDNYYLHDADVTVTDGEDTVTLTEFCLNDLPDALLPLVAAYLGIDLDTTGTIPINICLYTVPDIFTGTPAFVGEIGKSYTLQINWNGKTASSTTTLFPPVPMDSMYFKPHPDPENDSLVRLYVHLTEPEPLGNFYRYFTKRNSEAFYAGYQSVFDDNIVNGQSFEFTLDRGYNPTEDFDPDTYGYFWKGDTIILKWASIDFPTYDFFSTLEFDSGTDGPFSSATIAQTNITGGLGIWCAYGSYYDTLYVPY